MVSDIIDLGFGISVFIVAGGTSRPQYAPAVAHGLGAARTHTQPCPCEGWAHAHSRSATLNQYRLRSPLRPVHASVNEIVPVFLIDCITDGNGRSLAPI